MLPIGNLARRYRKSTRCPRAASRLASGAGLAAPIKRPEVDNTKTLAALQDTFAIVRGLLAGETVTNKGGVFTSRIIPGACRRRR
jgi:hypothetical protein